MKKLEVPTRGELDPGHLDSAVDAGVPLSMFVGRKVKSWGSGPGVVTKMGDGHYGVKVKLLCDGKKTCRKTSVAYLRSGIHHGAYPYAYGYQGKYLACLRDQVFICKECAADA